MTVKYEIELAPPSTRQFAFGLSVISMDAHPSAVTLWSNENKEDKFGIGVYLHLSYKAAMIHTAMASLC